MNKKIFNLEMHIAFEKKAINTFEGYLDGDAAMSAAHEQAVGYLRRYSSYETHYVSPRIRWKDVHYDEPTCIHLLKDNCKASRRRLYLRPIDEEKFSTQYEDHQVYWSNL